MSESEDGLIVPWTRQNGAFTATGTGGSLPTTLDGGDTLVAPVIVASPNVLPASAPQSVASAPPPANASAHAASALKPAKRALRSAHPDFAFDMMFPPMDAPILSPGAKCAESVTPRQVSRQLTASRRGRRLRRQRPRGRRPCTAPAPRRWSAP